MAGFLKLRGRNSIRAADAQPPNAGHGDVALVVEPATSVLVCVQYPNTVRIEVDEEIDWNKGAVGIDKI